MKLHVGGVGGALALGGLLSTAPVHRHAHLRLQEPVRNTRFSQPLFDPLGLHVHDEKPVAPLMSLPAVLATLPLLLVPGGARAENAIAFAADPSLDPANFRPVCPASDGVYRFGQTLVVGLVGNDNYKEYAPLIAGGLLRIRLELCVVESFVYEAIVPFVKENGLSWILPVHETVETFLAGVIFAVASNFILIGSTKLVTVIFTYGDVFFGLPLRLAGGAGWRSLEDKVETPVDPKEEEEALKGPFGGLFRPKPKYVPPPITKTIEANQSPGGLASVVLWGGLRSVGEASGQLRRFIEALDIFVGRYLLLTTVAYVGIKFVHFKIWDPFPM
mmetsp:Transcript_14519/g.31140  ORF Transcript_14519/g.31140 Transcript_14519/m.31140 type:complete len:331 (-) Transcript_14519:358-1350(-)